MTDELSLPFLGFAIIFTTGPGIWFFKNLIGRMTQLNAWSKRLRFRMLGWIWVILIVASFGMNWSYLLLGFSIFVNVWLAILMTVSIIIGMALKVYYSCCTPIYTGLWLRRFDVEPKTEFNLSRVFERLSISDIRIFTLADSKVKMSALSGRQSKIKLFLDFFVYILIPPSMFIFFSFIWFNVLINFELISRKVFIPDWFLSANFLLVLSVLLFLVFVSGIYNFIFNLRRIKLIGAGYTILNSNSLEKQIKDECDRISNLSQSDFLSGKRVYRVLDKDWKEAVSIAIENVDFIFFDATEYSVQMQWELDEVCRKNKLGRLVLMSANDVADNKFSITTTGNVIDELPEVLTYGKLSQKGKSGELVFLNMIKKCSENVIFR